ncbi:hypothetical protein FDH65_gp50 [Arthrobacter phage Circum]|uniref:Uncharacterized protein n=1 Tax=Arthrobacter phage Circum TaxID=1772295 RepID=A0A0U4IKK3_9CAUD|nr:hypothetical protein FDH65_gp50 [Arthrobacter phage Circum]ALY08735.1 hypothetical protein CIRCUM_50 [Arthrobacter phage Circum]
MFKKAVTFTNVDGQKVTQDFYFNLTKIEFSKDILRKTQGTVDPEDAIKTYGERLKRIGESGDPLLIIETFEEMVKASIGRRTEDGLFLKTPEYASAFVTSEAFSNLIEELTTNTAAATEFTNALLPAELINSAETARARSEAQLQGHQQKQQSTVSQVDLPVAGAGGVTLNETANPVNSDELAAFQAWQANQRQAGMQ